MRRTTEVTTPEMAMIVATRVLLGVGLGLLASERIERQMRRGIGWTMFLVGAASTVPLAVEVLSRRARERESQTARVPMATASGMRAQ
jgi:hypothetical protein